MLEVPGLWVTAEGSGSGVVELAWGYELNSVNDRLGEAELLTSVGAQKTLGEFHRWGIELHGLICTVGCQFCFAQ